MTTEPKGRRTASSGPRGMNLQQKMDDARARRAEKLSHNAPANDDARVQSAPKAMAKAPEPEVQQQPEPDSEPVPQDRSRSASKPRFPEIVMPPVSEAPKSAEKPPRRLGWLFPMVGLLLALILGALFVLPENAARTPDLSETESVVPAQVPDQAQEASAPNIDVRSELAQTGDAIPPPNTNAAAATPLQDTTSTPPDIFIVANFAPLNILQGSTPALPAALTVWGVKPYPASLIAPTRDTAFTSPNAPTPQATDLIVSLIIPAVADEADVRAVSTALNESGFTIRDPRRVGYIVRQTQVRYYHEADASSAATLADAIGGTLRDFTDYVPLPPEGMVEVFIAGRAPAESARPAPRGFVGDLRQFGADLRDTLNAITR